MIANYRIKSGVALREAIDEEDFKLIVKRLRICYEELYEKLSPDDRAICCFQIDDALVELEHCHIDEYEDAEEQINCWLTDLYDLCDEVGAWICTINEAI